MRADEDPLGPPAHPCIDPTYDLMGRCVRCGVDFSAYDPPLPYTRNGVLLVDIEDEEREPNEGLI